MTETTSPTRRRWDPIVRITHWSIALAVLANALVTEEGSGPHIWVGYGLGPIILLCALMVFFPILVSSVVGLRHVDPQVVDAARMDGAGSIALLRHIELPLALPNVLAGLRNGFTLSVTGAVVGEMVMGGSGLGQLLTVQRDSVDTAGMFATIVVLCAMASGLYGLIHLIERRSRTVASLLRTDRP